MLFNSLPFLIFFPCVFVLYYALPFRLRKYMLLIASYYFYMCWKPEFIVLILFSTLVDYFCGLGMVRYPGRKRWLLATSLVMNLGLLFFFKYLNFFGETLTALCRAVSIPFSAPALNIILPVGISFYTFQTLSYTLDVYKGKLEPEKNFVTFALFVSFFPQLVAGPIEKASNLLPQLKEEHRFTYENASWGAKLMAWGFFKKMVVADQLAILIVDPVYQNLGSYEGGILVLTNGVKVFIPASQSGVPRDGDLSTLLRKEVNFKILETNRQRRRALGSISAVLRAQREELAKKFWEEVEVGKVYTGVVKSITNFSVFVDLGGVDGRVGMTDLTWLRVKHPSEVVKVGDTVTVTVKDVDMENKKVSLIYKKSEDNPWEVIKTQHQVGDVVTVQIMSITAFGAFAQIIPGIDGLIHISQIARERVEKVADKLSVGDVVEAKITELDYEKKRASLSIKALLADREAAEEDANVAEAFQAEEAPVEE